MTEYSENLSITMSENGRKSYHFETPMMEGYGLARDPYREFRKGIKITLFDGDTGAESASLVANYAIFYEDRKLWEVKGDVVATNSDGRQLFTTLLQLLVVDIGHTLELTVGPLLHLLVALEALAMVNLVAIDKFRIDV